MEREVRFSARALMWTLAGGLAICSPSWAKAEEIVETTICEIVADDTKFEGRVVSVFATAHTSYHGDWLDDQSCPRSGIALRLPPVENWRGEMKRLGRAMNHGTGPSLSATGRFIGRLVLYRGDKEHPLEDMPLTLLDLHEVRDLVIAPETLLRPGLIDRIGARLGACHLVGSWWLSAHGGFALPDLGQSDPHKPQKRWRGMTWKDIRTVRAQTQIDYLDTDGETPEVTWRILLARVAPQERPSVRLSAPRIRAQV